MLSSLSRICFTIIAISAIAETVLCFYFPGSSHTPAGLFLVCFPVFCGTVSIVIYTADQLINGQR